MKTYIEFLKTEQKGIWASIQKAASEGLILIDEEHDSVTATNRLLLSYPGLHEVLNMLSEDWTLAQGKEHGSSIIQELMREDD